MLMPRTLAHATEATSKIRPDLINTEFFIYVKESNEWPLQTGQGPLVSLCGVTKGQA